MNITKKLLRVWISIVSLGGFLAGWAIIAQTAQNETPQDTTSPAAITIEMPAIPQIDQLVGQAPSQPGAVQNFTINRTQPPTSFTPQMRTGGS